MLVISRQKRTGWEPVIFSFFTLILLCIRVASANPIYSPLEQRADNYVPDDAENPEKVYEWLNEKKPVDSDKIIFYSGPTKPENGFSDAINFCNNNPGYKTYEGIFNNDFEADFGLTKDPEGPGCVACSKALAYYASDTVRGFRISNAGDNIFWKKVELPMVELNYDLGKVQALVEMNAGTTDLNAHSSNLLNKDEEGSGSGKPADNASKRWLSQRQFDAPDHCSAKYELVEDTFTMSGRGFDPNKFNANDADGFPQPGLGLYNHVKKCQGLSGWQISWDLTNTTDHLWTASGHVEIGQKSCLGEAIIAAGGSTHDECHGAG